ncbi:hypothetical protein L345_14403, partial [Ophiophagus hannah]
MTVVVFYRFGPVHLNRESVRSNHQLLGPPTGPGSILTFISCFSTSAASRGTADCCTSAVLHTGLAAEGELQALHTHKAHAHTKPELLYKSRQDFRLLADLGVISQSNYPAEKLHLYFGEPANTTSDWPPPHLFSASQSQLISWVFICCSAQEDGAGKQDSGVGREWVLWYPSSAMPTNPGHAHQATSTEPVVKKN